MKKSILIYLLFIANFCQAQSANNYAIVGTPCPELKFNEVKYYSRDKISSTDFKGQWLVLDFWNRFCSSCIQAMPRMDSLQNDYKARVNVFLVGFTGAYYNHKSEKEIKKLYAGLRESLKLKLPIAYDSVQFDRLNIGPCPYIIVVDPKGIVRAVTTKLKASDMQAFLEGREPKLNAAKNRKGV